MTVTALNKTPCGCNSWPMKNENTVQPGTDEHEQIKRRAFELWMEAGSPDGQEEDFWLQAERDLKSHPASKS